MSVRHSRGVYYVKNEDMPEFMKFVDSDYQVTIGPYRWAYTKSGTARDALVSEWMVVLQ